MTQVKTEPYLTDLRQSIITAIENAQSSLTAALLQISIAPTLGENAKEVEEALQTLGNHIDQAKDMFDAWERQRQRMYQEVTDDAVVKEIRSKDHIATEEAIEFWNKIKSSIAGVPLPKIDLVVIHRDNDDCIVFEWESVGASVTFEPMRSGEGGCAGIALHGYIKDAVFHKADAFIAAFREILLHEF